MAVFCYNKKSYTSLPLLRTNLHPILRAVCKDEIFYSILPFIWWRTLSCIALYVLLLHKPTCIFCCLDILFFYNHNKLENLVFLNDCTPKTKNDINVCQLVHIGKNLIVYQPSIIKAVVEMLWSRGGFFTFILGQPILCYRDKTFHLRYPLFHLQFFFANPSSFFLTILKEND